METIEGRKLNSNTAVIEFNNLDQENKSIHQEVAIQSINNNFENTQEEINICHLFMSNNFKQLDF